MWYDGGSVKWVSSRTWYEGTVLSGCVQSVFTRGGVKCECYEVVLYLLGEKYDEIKRCSLVSHVQDGADRP